MANYANLKATINANIKANGTEAITGPILNSVLTAAVNTLGAGYQFMGVATTSTNPGTPDANVFYIAATPGTYTNFGGKTVADGEVAILKYNGSWTKEVTGAATAAQVTQLGQEVSEQGLHFEGDSILLNAPADAVTRTFTCNIPANTDFNLGEVSGKYWNSGIQVVFKNENGTLLDTGKTYDRNTVKATHNFNEPCTAIDIKVYAGSNTDCVFSLQNPTSVWGTIDKVIIHLVSFARSDALSGVTAKGQLYYKTDSKKIRRVTNDALTSFEDVAFVSTAVYECGGALYVYDGTGLVITDRSWRFADEGVINTLIKEVYAYTKPSDFDAVIVKVERGVSSGANYVNRIRIGNENLGLTAYVDITKSYASQADALADTSKETLLESDKGLALVDLSTLSAGTSIYFYYTNHYDIFDIKNSPRIASVLNARKLDDAFTLLGNPIGIINNSTLLSSTDVTLANFPNLDITQFFLDIKELTTASVFIAIAFANSSTIYSDVNFYSGFHNFDDTITSIRIYANHLRPTDELVSIKAVLYNDSEKSIDTAGPTPYDYMEQAMSLSPGVNAAAKANGTSKYDEIRAASSNPDMDDICCAIIYNLRKASYDRRIPYGYFLDWESQDRYMENEDNYCEQVDGVWTPKSLADIDLTDATLAESAGGPAPSMNVQDFYTCIGNDFESEDHAKNQAAMIGAVQKTWAVSKVLQSFSWHLENPYAPVGYSQMKCRYSDSHNVVEEILNDTGDACGFSEDYPDGQFVNPKQWFDYRLAEVAGLIKEFVDEDGHYIPIILRLWHEMEDGWAWWQLGRGVSIEDYQAFFKYTVETLNTLAETNRILIAFNADKYLRRPAQDMLQKYVPLAYVDIVSFDYYNIQTSPGELENAIGYAREFTTFAERNGKICAIAETGGSADKTSFFSDLAKLITAPGVRVGYLNSWITSSTWIPTDNNTIKDAYAKLVKRQNLYNIGTMPDMTEIVP